jgi:hypothetical protein
MSFQPLLQLQCCIAGNQTAVSIVEAKTHKNASKCIVAGTAVNNVTVLTGCDDPPLVPEGSTNTSTPGFNGLAASWHSAPGCKAPPTKHTAVADTMNRLWGFENNARYLAFTDDIHSIMFMQLVLRQVYLHAVPDGL